MTQSSALRQQLTVIPVTDEGLGNQSYFVALEDGRALVIDPSRDPGPYQQIAVQLGLRLAFSAETHLHADFISGSRELAAQNATILAPRAAALAAPHRALDHGDEVALGDLTLRAIATPGHTPEHLAYLVFDGSTPCALFSGGALIPGGAARTDLIDQEQNELLTHALFRSVREHLAPLPDELVIYPTHGAGSFCSAAIGGQRVTTLGQERKVNPLLTATDEAAFVQAFLSGLGSYPTYFTHLRAVNRQGARLYGSHLPELPRLSVADIERELAAGASLIDTRPYRDFAEGHIRGALSIALRPAFASWLGWLLPPDRALVFVMGDGQDRRDLVSQSLKIGYEDLRGELGDGMAAWLAANRPLATIALRQVGDDLGPHLLDVRQDSEWSGGHLAGAEHLELGSLISSAQRLPSGPMTVYCGHGERAMTAASLLEAHACRDLAVLDGGFEAWTKANNPVAVD